VNHAIQEGFLVLETGEGKVRVWLAVSEVAGIVVDAGMVVLAMVEVAGEARARVEKDNLGGVRR